MKNTIPHEVWEKLEDVLQRTADRLEIPVSALREDLTAAAEHCSGALEEPLLPEELLLLCLLVRPAP